jgi:hypothetical protein
MRDRPEFVPPPAASSRVGARPLQLRRHLRPGIQPGRRLRIPFHRSVLQLTQPVRRGALGPAARLLPRAAFAEFANTLRDLPWIGARWRQPIAAAVIAVETVTPVLLIVAWTASLGFTVALLSSATRARPALPIPAGWSSGSPLSREQRSRPTSVRRPAAGGRRPRRGPRGLLRRARRQSGEPGLAPVRVRGTARRAGGGAPVVKGFARGPATSRRWSRRPERPSAPAACPGSDRCAPR